MKSKILAGLSLILAIGASILMSFWGASYMATGPEGQVISGRTGAFHPILIVFVLFPLIGLAGIHQQNQRVVWMAAVGMSLLAVLSLLGAGLIFLPSVILLINAAIFFRKGESRSFDNHL